MKIDDSMKKAAGLTSVNGASGGLSRSGKASVKTDVEKGPTDSVTLSPKAQALASQNSGSGVFDADKVNQIKAAIASGQFKINAEKIADGLLDSVKDIISTRKDA